jgi:spore maturation protein SpmA
VLSWIWLGIVLISVVWAALVSGEMAAVTASVTDGARSAVTLVIGLVGVMVFFLGLTRVAFDGGLRDAFARALAPITRRLFPDVPADHPAMSAMIMNMASNMLGMGNAATPFGLKAMRELGTLAERPGIASNAIVLFLAINTSAITILPPVGTIAIRAQTGSTDPWAIWVPTLIATTCSTASAVIAYFLLSRLPIFAVSARADVPYAPEVASGPTASEMSVDAGLEAGHGSSGSSTAPASTGRRRIVRLTALVLLIAVGWFFVGAVPDVGFGDAFKIFAREWMLPLLIVTLLLVGVGGGADIYASLIAGSKEGLEVAVRIVPYLVAMLTAVAMLRASGALGSLIATLDPYTAAVGVPAEVLPMAFLRPLSGSGAFGVMSEILTTYGPDTFIGYLTSTLMGSTETTFYVLALYLGAAGVVDGRHALLACVIGDLGGFVGAVVACHWFFG